MSRDCCVALRYGSTGFVYILRLCFFLSILTSFAIIFLGKKAARFTLLFSECHVTVIVLTFPHSAMGWSVVCDYGISWLYSFFGKVHDTVTPSH